jgi:hypothetical protein
MQVSTNRALIPVREQVPIRRLVPMRYSTGRYHRSSLPNPYLDLMLVLASELVELVTKVGGYPT